MIFPIRPKAYARELLVQVAEELWSALQLLDWPPPDPEDSMISAAMMAATAVITAAMITALFAVIPPPRARNWLGGLPGEVLLRY